MLEKLILQDTPSLKVFPSVYAFGGLRVAELTYPHHCCAFQFPQQHDASRDDTNKKFVQNKGCPDHQNKSPTDAPRPRPSFLQYPEAAHPKARSRRHSQSGGFPQGAVDTYYRAKFLRTGSLSDEDRHVDPASGAVRISPLRRGLDHLDPATALLTESFSHPEGNEAVVPLDKDGLSRVPFNGGFRETSENVQDLQWQIMPFGPGGEGGGDLSLPLGFGPINATDHEGFPALASPFHSEGGFRDSLAPLYPDSTSFSDLPDDDFPGHHLAGHHLSGFLEDSEDLGHGTFHTAEVPVKNLTQEFRCGNFVLPVLSVQCTPAPNAFNPCEDIMGNSVLRVAVWVVVVKAVLGNTAVIVVLSSTRFRMSVSKFLILNLAAADLMMGVYLLLIASMDLHSISQYFNFAIDWQNGPGCRMAGFLSVFSSELSIFSLTVITIERWYAITYAIHLNKRLKLLMAVKIMLVGWLYSLFMAALPLIGVSDYGKTSICLPMDASSMAAVGYLAALLCFNTLAFVAISGCYVSMYCSIQSHNPITARSDLTVAKRMALLVFTDFACWAPIAFFAVTALAGVHFIDVTRAKILLVFFYPLNSCANPYLYAIMTKQYRRDLLLMLEARGLCTDTARRYRSGVSSVNNSLHHMTTSPGQHHRSSTLTQVTMCEAHKQHRGSCPSQCHNGGVQGVGASCTLPSPELASTAVATAVNDRSNSVHEYPRFMADHRVSTNSRVVASLQPEFSSNSASAAESSLNLSTTVPLSLPLNQNYLVQPTVMKSPIVTSPSSFALSADGSPLEGSNATTTIKNNLSVLKIDAAPSNSLSASTISSSVSLSPVKRQCGRERSTNRSRTGDFDDEDVSDGGHRNRGTSLKFGKFQPILNLRGDDFELPMIDSSASSSEFEDDVALEMSCESSQKPDSLPLEAEIQKDLKASEPVFCKSRGNKYEKLSLCQDSVDTNASSPPCTRPVNYIRAKVSSNCATNSLLFRNAESYV